MRRAAAVRVLKPANVIEGSRVEVSFVAAALIDKFAYHLPCTDSTSA